MSKLESYYDLEHAVGIIHCLELHFLEITKVLDKFEVPKISVKTDKDLTVVQRVNILAEAFEDAARDSNNGEMADYLRWNGMYEGEPAEVLTPEQILEAIRA